MRSNAKRFERFFLSLAALLLTAGSAAAAPETLFVIERSKNANIVQYDAQVAADKVTLDAKDPIVGYWIMKAENGRREPLTKLEKRAYGFSVKRDGGGPYDMRLDAYKERTIRVYRYKGKWRAVIFLAEKTAFLTKMFIATREGGIIPTVEYIEIVGVDVATGQTLKERIVAP
jgi:hypothetical protein